ncbi:MAG: hypothetical protein ACOH1T_00985 [Microbacteriaceae bacterium]
MADNNIHTLFTKSDDAGLGSIDTASVIRRSKARRRPAQLVTGGALVLALGGFGVFGVQALLNSQPTVVSASDSGVRSGDGLTFTAEEQKAADHAEPTAATLNLCATPVAEVAPSDTGLQLTVDFPAVAAASSGSPISGTVTLTNDGTQRITGTTAAVPSITLARNGVVTWHSNGPMIMMAVMVDLAPGESMEFAASVTPVVCGASDDTAAGFADTLPTAPPGVYEVSAAIDVLSGDTAELVTGPSSTLTLN